MLAYNGTQRLESVFIKNKKALRIKFQRFLCIFHFGAQNKTRTCTPEPAPAPQAGVSTNSTTWAG